jgi:hypothetical protein
VSIANQSNPWPWFDNQQTYMVQNMLSEKDAEIERMKALITELADALEQQSYWSTKVELIQRAREATNG